MRSILYGAFAAALLSPLAVQAAPSAKGQPMRQVDWKNHTYQHSEAGGVVTLKAGEWGQDHVEDGEVMYSESLDLHGVIYVDLNGDAIEEAVVHLNYWGGGTGRFDELLVYTRGPDQKPKLIGRIPGGDRGDGGIAGLKAVESAVQIGRMMALAPDGTCCPSLVLDERWALIGGEMVELADHRRISAMEDDRPDPSGQKYKAAYKAGMAELKGKGYEVAVKHFIDALSYRPRDTKATAKLGFALMKSGDFTAAAVLSAAAAAQKDPKKKAMILYNAGRVAMDGKSYAEAIKHFEGSLKLRPGNAPTESALAEAKAQQAKIVKEKKKTP